MTHYRGEGSPLIRAVQEADIEWQVAVMFQPAFQTEKYMKSYRSAKDFCPICRINPLLPPDAIIVENWQIPPHMLLSSLEIDAQLHPGKHLTRNTATKESPNWRCT